jgi:hypothetical protein
MKLRVRLDIADGKLARVMLRLNGHAHELFPVDLDGQVIVEVASCRGRRTAQEAHCGHLLSAGHLLLLNAADSKLLLKTRSGKLVTLP